MRKTFTAALILVFVAVPVLLAHTGPEKVTLKAAVAKQGPVTFAHAKHAQLIKTCDTCHHNHKGMTAENTKADTKVTKCTTCHLDPKDKAGSMREMSLTKNPFHSLCLGCHKKDKKGPATCTGCHAKK